MNTETVEKVSEETMAKTHSVECPICHKEIDRRGLNGHIRMAHSKKSGEAQKLGVGAVPSRQERRERLAELLRDLEQSREDQKRATAAKRKGLFENDAAADALISGFKQNEKEIEEEIKELTKDLKPGRGGLTWL